MIEINEHDIRYVDMRPIKGKRVPTCMKCGIDGLRKLKKTRCERA